MSHGAGLLAALQSVDWNANIAALGAHPGEATRLAACNYRLALWASQLENAETGNPALSFVRSMQVEGHYASTLIALALYKPAAAAMRAALESALYYTYFRSHLAELATIATRSDYYIDKKEILDFHKVHTPRFSETQNGLGLLGKLAEWYSKISGVVHGQRPGNWVTSASIKATKHNDAARMLAVESFEEGTSLVDKLFLCTVAQEPSIWAGFTKQVRGELLKGIPGNVKGILQLSVG